VGQWHRRRPRAAGERGGESVEELHKVGQPPFAGRGWLLGIREGGGGETAWEGGAERKGAPGEGANMRGALAVQGGVPKRRESPAAGPLKSECQEGRRRFASPGGKGTKTERREMEETEERRMGGSGWRGGGNFAGGGAAGASQ